MRKQTGSRNRGWLSVIGNRLSVAAGVALAAGMMAALAPRAEAVLASGGAVTNYTTGSAPKQTNWTAHIFRSSGIFSNFSLTSAEVLVVAGGGGGGGRYGGGGGAGGLIYTSSFTLVSGSNYTVTVGGGGAGTTNVNGDNGTAGSNSVFGSLTAWGGGYGGGPYATSGGNGGSGGGGSGNDGGRHIGGQPIDSLQGFRGGDAAGNYGGGGGGGAGGQGVDGNSSGGDGKDGGPGKSNNITGAWVWYAGGGGGGSWSGNGGKGGSSIGGSGATNGSTSTSGGTGAVNTGSGGGGGGLGGNGGSGIVIVRYVTPITVSPSTLNFGSIVFVGTTNVLTNTVSGVGLTDNITITVSPSSVYAISTNAVDYSSSLTLTTNASGNVPATNIYVRFTPTEVGSYPGAITNISGSATQVVTLVATAIPIQPLFHDASPSSLSFGNVITNKPSASPLTVSGSHLTNNVTVTAPSSSFTLSADNVTFSDSPLVLTTNAVGTVNSNIWVRFIPTAAVNYDGAITNISGSLTQTVAVAGTGVVPGISVSAGTLNFNNVITNATSNLTYTVSGSNLQADVALSVLESTGFTIKTNGGVFGTSVTLAVPNKTELAGGTLSNQTITVQFAPTVVQTYPSADITASSAGAVSKTTTLNGNGVMPPPTVSITAPSANQLFNIGTPVSLTATVVPGNAPYGVKIYTNRYSGGYGLATNAAATPNTTITVPLGVLTSGTYHVFATVTDSVSSVTYTSAVSIFIVQPAVPAGMLASGGDQTYITNLNGKVYGVHVFKTTDIAGFVPQTALTKVEYLVVGGGGAGGGGNNKYPGGGGGAGGMLTGTVATAVSQGTYTIVVGAGGAGTTDNGANGGNSYAFSNSVIEVMANGGGGGGKGIGNGLPGGSGGGGGSHWGSHGAFGAGTSAQGNDGGTGSNGGGSGGGASGGGGGKGGKGGNGVNNVSPGTAGSGTNCSISGVSMTYATGGAGNMYNNPVNGTAAAANLGNGGQGAGANNGDGGNSYNGGNGGSGIVIIRYDMTPPKGTVIMMR